MYRGRMPSTDGNYSGPMYIRAKEAQDSAGARGQGFRSVPSDVNSRDLLGLGMNFDE